MRPRRLAGLAGLALLGLALALAWHWLAAPPRVANASAAARFARWQATNPGRVAEYLGYLQRQGVGEVLPPEQLLRLGRRWERCGGVEFSLPPRELWPRIVPTLKLLASLQSEGLLRDARVASAWRPQDYNRCEGGSQASRHLDNLALDLDLPNSQASRVQALCQRWRQIGPARHWGLGFYSPTRVHLDTAGFRSWGYDYRGKSSLCTAPDRGEGRRIG